MPEDVFQTWRRRNESRPLDPVPDVLRSIATLTAVLLQAKGIDIDSNTFLPPWMRD